MDRWKERQIDVKRCHKPGSWKGLRKLQMPQAQQGCRANRKLQIVSNVITASMSNIDLKIITRCNLVLLPQNQNKPRNCLWSADVNINASLHLVILFKSIMSKALERCQCLANFIKRCQNQAEYLPNTAAKLIKRCHRRQRQKDQKANSPSEASLACQEPPGLAPDRQGQLQATYKLAYAVQSQQVVSCHLHQENDQTVICQGLMT